MFNMPSFGCLYNQELEDEEEILEEMYPNIYRRIYPWIHYYCCDMEVKMGEDYIPNKEQCEKIVENIYDKIKDNIDDMYVGNYDEEKDNEYERKSHKGRKRPYSNLIKILLIRDLIDRRKRRRRRRRKRRRRY
ncbi:hypothetical protein SH2C18_37100 [Clostridium sediminicola]|uniref:hypothetical protein n=1 Tax=Clostridium sediminicola TaxID=3114879 RepID=UPI0031F1CE07